MVVFKYPYIFNHMEIEGNCFYSQAKFCVDLVQGAHFGATPTQEGEVAAQTLNNNQGNHL